MDTTPATRKFTAGYPENAPPDLDGNPAGGGPWMRIDGLEIALTPRDRTVIKPAKEASGTYGSNHGLIQATDENGYHYMAADNNTTRAALKKAGYRDNGAWVIMTHGEQFTDPAAAAEFSRMRKLAFPREEGYILRDRSVDVTGAYVDASIPLRKKIAQIEAAPEHHGTYNISDTGIIAFVTDEGKVRLAAQNPLPGQGGLTNYNNFESFLIANGYQKDSSLGVPFAHGEKPLKMLPPDKYGATPDAAPTPVVDELLDRKIAPLRNTREYEVVMRRTQRVQSEGRAAAEKFLDGYHGSKPVSALTRHMQSATGKDGGEHSR